MGEVTRGHLGARNIDQPPIGGEQTPQDPEDWQTLHCERPRLGASQNGIRALLVVNGKPRGSELGSGSYSTKTRSTVKDCDNLADIELKHTPKAAERPADTMCDQYPVWRQIADVSPPSRTCVTPRQPVPIRSKWAPCIWEYGGICRHLPAWTYLPGNRTILRVPSLGSSVETSGSP